MSMHFIIRKTNNSLRKIKRSKGSVSLAEAACTEADSTHTQPGPPALPLPSCVTLGSSPGISVCFLTHGIGG